MNQFIKGDIVKLDKLNRLNPIIFHYYTEIVRFWNKLNFIFQKTLRSLKSINYPLKDKAKYIYLIYRKILENESNKNLINELNLSPKQDTYIIRFINKLNTFSWKKALEGKTDIEKLSIEGAIPTFFIDHLLSVMSFKFIKENVISMNNYQNFKNYLRINKLGTKISTIDLFNDLKRELKANQIPLQQDCEIPELFYIPNDKKSIILKSKSYLSGNLIFQDKASVAVVKILSPQRYELICDMCAAPGNKTNLIAHYTLDKARIVACEFLTSRIYEMSKNFKQSHNLNILSINTDSIQLPLRLENQFDRVLLDAPCTGSGTFQTNPELKWRQNNSFLYQNITLQEKLIKTSLNFLKPNGILVYSTCSLYAEEGEMQILKILDQLKPLQLPEWFSPSYRINGNIIHGTGRLFPSIHHTHGFFIGKFKKKEEQY